MINMKKRLLLYLVITTSWLTLLQAQVYPDHFGAGHNVGVTVSTSSDNNNNVGDHSLNGTGFFTDLEGASRFLGQATLGANYEAMEYVQQIGISAWLDEQISLSPTPSYYDTYLDIYNNALTKINAVHGDADSIRRWDYMNYAFYQKTLTEPTALRHKVAHALSQIFVISIQENDIANRGFAMSTYYDLLYQGAFGNFHDLLTNVTLHPAMGIYLSHFKNRKADPDQGTLPDENFAREIMQLFTIGLFEMNNDGSYQLDSNGELIPTYDITDIQELAKVFTGLSGSAWDLILKPENAGDPLVFYKGYNHYDLTQPMAMYQDYHETGPKTMIDGSVIPAGQDGMQDIDDALTVLCNHQNVAPFISFRLIQQLVKSNPSPAYINRISATFNNNGAGIRGDLEAVVRAILTDPEARDCDWINEPTTGKLRQPLERITNLFASFDITSPSGLLWFRDFQLMYPHVEQSFLSAPTVFNFFTPFYAEEAFVAPNDMVSPEFQILHATSGISYINAIENSIKTRPFRNRTAVHSTALRLNYDYSNVDLPYLDFTDEIALYNSSGLSALVDRLDLILCHGQLSDGTKNIIVNAINQYIADDSNFTDQEVINDVLYFIMMSPDYLILK